MSLVLQIIPNALDLFLGVKAGPVTVKVLPRIVSFIFSSFNFLKLKLCYNRLEKYGMKYMKK